MGGWKGKRKIHAAAKRKSKGVHASIGHWPSFFQPKMITVEEFEREIIGRCVSVDQKAKMTSKKPIDTVGRHCKVRKHSGMGCAVVSLSSFFDRQMLMTFIEHNSPPEGPTGMEINGVRVNVKRHTDHKTDQEVVTDVFVAWGHKVEKDTPLAADVVAEAFDQMYEQAELMNWLTESYMHDPGWYSTSWYGQLASSVVAAAPAGQPWTPPSTRPKGVQRSMFAEVQAEAQPANLPVDRVFGPNVAPRPNPWPIVDPHTGECLSVLEVANFQLPKAAKAWKITHPSTGEVMV